MLSLTHCCVTTLCFFCLSAVTFLLPVVFLHSGVTQTLCRGAWSSLTGGHSAFQNVGTSTAQKGCCPPGNFMASPNTHPFSIASSCETCPAGYYGSAVNNAEKGCTRCPLGKSGFTGQTSCTDAVPLPNDDGGTDGSAGTLRLVVSDWIVGGASRNTVVATYGLIEDWDVSEVTNMQLVFYGGSIHGSTFGSFNADLSKWNTGAVTNMRNSKCNLSSSLKSSFI